MKKMLIVLTILLSGLGPAVIDAHGGANIPGRTKFLVNDYARILSPETGAYLEKLLCDVRGKDFSGTEIVVSTFADTGAMPSEDFVRQYTRRWRRPLLLENDNRIHIILLIKEGKVRLGIGRYVEKVITPDITTNIIANVMIPELGYGSYDTSVKKGVETIVGILEKNKLPKSRAFLYARYSFRSIVLIIFALAIFFIVMKKSAKIPTKRPR